MGCNRLGSTATEHVANCPGQPPSEGKRQHQKELRGHVCCRATSPRRLRHGQICKATRSGMWKETAVFPRQNVVSFLSRLSQRHCYRAWLLSDHRSDLGSPISLSATPTEHGCRLIPAVSLHRRLSLAPLLQSMAGNRSLQ